jgi:hypothetical protein
VHQHFTWNDIVSKKSNKIGKNRRELQHHGKQCVKGCEAARLTLAPSSKKTINFKGDKLVSVLVFVVGVEGVKKSLGAFH